jgi:hypothetical protein
MIQPSSSTEDPCLLTNTGSSVALECPISFNIPDSPTVSPFGHAVDSATVSVPQGASQATLALAVFGNNAAMQRCSYTAYIITGEGGIVVVDPPVVTRAQ